MNPEALILRRCYPVPVTFADLRAAAMCMGVSGPPRNHVVRFAWQHCLKVQTGAIDEIYAVVDGREVRVATVRPCDGMTEYRIVGEQRWPAKALDSLCQLADEQGYWERPHEVRLDLSPRPVSHNEVAKAVLVGQGYVERHAVK